MRHHHADGYDHRYAVKHDFRQFIETEDDDDDYLLDRSHAVHHQEGTHCVYFSAYFTLTLF
jgi:hypothetical protein